MSSRLRGEGILLLTEVVVCLHGAPRAMDGRKIAHTHQLSLPRLQSAPGLKRLGLPALYKLADVYIA